MIKKLSFSLSQVNCIHGDDVDVKTKYNTALMVMMLMMITKMRMMML